MEQDNYSKTGSYALKHTSSDLAADSGFGQVEVYHDDEALRRKIDWILLPFLCGIYFLQYLDKTLLNYASVMGLRQDTGIDTSQFAFLGTIFYVAYLIAEPPTNLLMQRLPLTKYLSANIILWGIVTACHGAATNYTSLVVLRVLLGIFESCVAPALILITGMWYTKAEQARRTGVWYLMIGVAQIVGAIISFAFQHISHAAIANWRILFIVLGVATVVVGVLTMIFLPDNPRTARQLTEAERIAAVEHVRVNMTGVECKVFKAYQMKQALLDPQSWFLVAITILSMIDNGAVSNFSSIIISGFGYSNEKTTILQIPSGLVSIVAVFFSCFMVSRIGQRCYFIALLCLPSVLGAALLTGLPKANKIGQLFGVYLLNSAPALLPIVYSWSSSNVAGHTKKVTVNAMILMAFSLGNIIGPQMFQTADAPRYIPAKASIMATLAAVVVVSLLLRVYTMRQNHKKEAVEGKSGGIGRGESDGLEDVTDGDNPAFRYVY